MGSDLFEEDYNSVSVSKKRLVKSYLHRLVFLKFDVLLKSIRNERAPTFVYQNYDVVTTSRGPVCGVETNSRSHDFEAIPLICTRAVI